MSDQPVDLNLEELRELIKLLRESNVSEFELRKADYRLRIKHGNLVEAGQENVSTPIQASLPVPVNGGGEPSTAVQSPAAVPEEKVEELHEIRSPMVGTFYRSSTPGASSFVEIGDTVRKNQVICIIEAMKIMNEIESDVEGEVREIHLSNGHPVEFGELLFSIKPTE